MRTVQKNVNKEVNVITKYFRHSESIHLPRFKMTDNILNMLRREVDNSVYQSTTAEFNSIIYLFTHETIVSINGLFLSILCSNGWH